MLQSIRDRATGPIAWGIVGLITIPFAFWGIDSYVSGPTNPEVAEVGGVEISQGQLQRAYDQQYQRLQQMMGENFDPDSINNAQLRRGVLESLVREELLTQHVRNAGYRVSDVTVANNLRQQSAFLEDGSFSSERYRTVLARSGYTPAAYEARLRNALAVDQLQQGMTNSAFVTDAEIDAAARLEKQKRRIQYLVFDTERLAKSADVTKDDIQKYYDAQPARFSTAERVRLDYLEIDKAKLPVAKNPDDAVLAAMYEAEKQSRFTTPEQRKARHILILAEEGDEEASKAKINDLRNKIKSGSDFESLAKSHSDDTGSKDSGGDLGWVGRGVMVPEFEAALFSLPEGQLSEPVKTPFGWHLIRVEEIRERQMQPLESDEVQKVLLDIYKEKELAERFQQLTKRLDDLAFDDPDTLETAEDELNIKLKTTDWLERESTEGLGQHQQVLDAAFSPTVLNDRENSSLLKLSEDRYLVLRISDYEPARQRPLKEVRDDIESQLRMERGLAKAQELAADAVKAMEAGESVGSVATSMGVSVNAPGWVERDDAQLDARLLTTVFSMPKPKPGEHSISSGTMVDGNQAVIVLNAVQDGDPGSLSKEAREDIARRLSARIANVEFRIYEAAVRDSMDVNIHEERLQ